MESLFLIPANTFDNVKGQFPIGFFVWNTGANDTFKQITANVYYNTKECIAVKEIIAPTERTQYITSWLTGMKGSKSTIGVLAYTSNDFQNKARMRIIDKVGQSHHTFLPISKENLISYAISFAVRLAVKHTWLNDRDQFLYPQEGWQQDHEFQNNCLVYTLFHTQNRISANEGTNHWIPFTEKKVNARLRYESHFMTDFMAGRCASGASTKYEVLSTAQSGDKELTKPIKGTLRDLGEERAFVPTEPLVFSPEAIAVLDAGRELWRYYHAQPNANPNASYYDIREYFQGRSEKGKMNAKSEDAEYNRLFLNLKEAMELLRLTIVPKVYEYKFLIN